MLGQPEIAIVDSMAVDATGSTIVGGRDEASILPSTIIRYILSFSGYHQIALIALSVVVFLLTTAPLEFQRRIINEATHQQGSNLIIWLVLGYAGVAFLQAACKFLLNIYRSWVSETAVRHLRKTIYQAYGPIHSAQVEGVEISLILTEVEPIGGFVGISISEPLLQVGILLSVFGYMVFLQPEIAVVSALVFSPQLIFVPLMQGAINRRVEARIWVLRDVSIGLIDGSHEQANAAVQQHRIDKVFLLNMGIYKLKFTMKFLMNFLNYLGIAAVLAIGGWYVANGRAEIGTVVAFISGISKVNDPWSDIVSWFRDAMVNGVKYRLITEAVEKISKPKTGEASELTVEVA
jgi:ABC-type multidrug transport system fused ATPase/permease subunit